MLFADRYHQVFDKSFPLLILNDNSKNNWFDKDLQKLLHCAMFRPPILTLPFSEKNKTNGAKWLKYARRPDTPPSQIRSWI